MATTVYISENDVEDEVLKDTMVEADYIFASSELETLVVNRLSLTTDVIVIPLHLTVKEFVLAVAYARRAELNIGMGNRLMDGVDVYAYKHKMYCKKVIELAERITPSMITGDSTSGKWSPSIDIFRS